MTVELVFFDPNDPRLADSLSAWTTLVCDVDVRTERNPEFAGLGAGRSVLIADRPTQTILLRESPPLHAPSRIGPFARGVGYRMVETEPAWKPIPFREGIAVALRFRAGGRPYRFLGTPQSQRSTLQRGIEVVETEIHALDPCVFPFWRRWNAGFWPWNGEFMDGEANKVWEAIGALERRAEAHSHSHGLIDATMKNILAVLKKQAEPEPEVRRLYSLPTAASSLAAEGRPAQVEIEKGVRYVAWSGVESAWVNVDIIRAPNDPDEEEDAFDESDDE